MNVCIPIAKDRGLESKVFPHFGSAPMFLVVDTESRSCRAISNAGALHAHGACSPLTALAGERVDRVIVGGIGPGALARLAASRIPVHQAGAVTVGEALEALAAGALQEVGEEGACRDGHGAGHGGHGHGGAHLHLHRGA